MVVLTKNDSIAHNDVPVDLIDWRSRDETSTMDFSNCKEARAVFERRFSMQCVAQAQWCNRAGSTSDWNVA